MHLTSDLDLLATAEETLGASWPAVAVGHRDEPDGHDPCRRAATPEILPVAS